MSYRTQETSVIKDIEKLTITLASPDDILTRSRGEVTKPETINYRSFRPEKDGLFCEKIFGPTRDWECYCGKYKRIRYKGIICDRCGVEVTQKSVRRERMGHIELAVPVVHIWFFKSLPSKIGNLLGFSSKELERIIYYESYVVIQPGKTGLNKFDLITEEAYFNILNTLPAGNDKLDDADPNKFYAKIGGEAVKEMLRNMNIEGLFKELKEKVKVENSQQKKEEYLKRLKVIEAFREKPSKPTNRPEWMVLSHIPVIPPELRPLVPLEGGRFATSDLNDLYRRVIIRNNRLRRLIDIKAPEVILRNEKRMLQEAVDALFDNSRRGSAVRSDNNRPLKSLSDMLKGKGGRFRQNLLGKRVDYSGRSVIVVGPELKLHQCGLPKDMAVELFKPFIIRKLIERGNNKTVKSAKKVVDRKDPVIWEILERIIDGHPVLLNRAPTLHRLGIQAFQPVLIDEKAIRLHPMVCTAFNADFDGDQMAVHVPLSHEAQLEAQLLMLSSHNILSPQNGNPIVVPSQDIVLGCYYLTKSKLDPMPKLDLPEGATEADRRAAIDKHLEQLEKERPRFGSFDEVIIAYNHKIVGLHDKIRVRIDGKMVTTTTGRVIFNQIVPKEMGYYNQTLVKKQFGSFIGQMFFKLGNKVTSKFLDDLKDLGFNHAMRGGISISFIDMVIPEEKAKIIDKANREVAQIFDEYENGLTTDSERYNRVIDTWTHTTNNVATVLMKKLAISDGGFNPIHMMVESGARGSIEQVRQLAGMRGLMQKPQKSLTGQAGEIIENPIIANFKEGLSVLEYFISTHGARKGLADTALKTADAGYLTRRLVDVAQDVIISDIDCQTPRGIEMTALKDGEDVRESLSERISGRVSSDDVHDPVTNEILLESGEMITDDKAKAVEEALIDMVKIRSVLTCEAKIGVCAKCYGRNLTNGKMVEVGEAVGVIAAQSIGEPGTQLTLRTFHQGGTSARVASQSQIVSAAAGKVVFVRISGAERNTPTGKSMIVLGRRGHLEIYNDSEILIKRYDVPYGAELLVQDGQRINKDQMLYQHDPYNSLILTDIGGKIRFSDLEEGVTYTIATDEITQNFQRVVIEPKDKSKIPSIIIESANGITKTFNLPAKAYIAVEEGTEIEAGTILAKIAKQTAKTKDITGGLPRVTELFEARAPQDPAVVSDIEGVVTFGAKKRGAREVIVTSLDGSEVKKYSVQFTKHVLAQEGDEINAGERITDGPINPHDILRIKGTNAVQEYLVNEIQEVYRLQGVKINDKHIEVIVKQMLNKVRIKNSGDSKFLEDELVDKFEVDTENAKLADSFFIDFAGDSKKYHDGQVISEIKAKEENADLKRKNRREMTIRDAEEATFESVLLGITSAALSTESFISAASFQETTKVLASASVAAKTDTLRGLKENVIMGRLIPAGTGLKKYRSLTVDGNAQDTQSDAWKTTEGEPEKEVVVTE